MRTDLFWPKVVVTGKDSCWGWRACIDDSGYGKLGNDRAHRVSFRIHRGPIPRGKFVLHTCDNPRCTNPRHLYAGTKKNNAQDRERRGRGNHARGDRNGACTHRETRMGARNGRAKLTEPRVRQLLRFFKQGTRKAELARLFGLSKTSVGRIVSGKLWPHVEGR